MRPIIIDEYYEAKVQIRPLNEELYNFVIKELSKNKINIAKQHKLKEGIDLYISSSKICYSLAKKFKARFKGEIKISTTLVGLDKTKGKKINRVTLLLKLIDKLSE